MNLQQLKHIFCITKLKKDLLTKIDVSRLQHLIAAHLSENNNRPHLARELLSAVPACRHVEIMVADQPAGMPWKTLQ